MADPQPPTETGPLARREARLAWSLLYPTIAIVAAVVVLPLFAVFWISFKPIGLAYLRPPTPVVREALRGLSEQIRTRTEVRREPDTEFDWMGLVDDLRHRLSNFGVAERSAVVDEFGMDEVALERARGLNDFLLERYWRVELMGQERLPRSGNAPSPC